MTPIIIIPARLAATRLPGKPLAEIGGVPMIVRVLRCAEQAAVGPVVVAADRVLSVINEIDPAGKHDVIINLQGDMPFVSRSLLTDCAALLAEQPRCDIATIVSPVTRAEDLGNPNLPKAVLAMAADGRSGRALYFTRSTLYGEGPVWGHYGVYAYRRDALARFCAAPPSPLERREKLEQLRALEMGLTIWASVVAEPPISVDTPADLEVARAYALKGNLQ